MTIDPISASTPLHDATPSQPTQRPAATSFAHTLDAATVDTMPASPPPEVRAAMATAAAAHERFAASGHTLRFGLDTASGRVTAVLTDASGAAVRTLSGSQVLAIADGRMTV